MKIKNIKKTLLFSLAMSFVFPSVSFANGNSVVINEIESMLQIKGKIGLNYTINLKKQ